MKSVALCIGLIFALQLACGRTRLEERRDAPREYFGKLDAELQPNVTFRVPAGLKSASAEEKAKLSVQLQNEDKVFAGNLKLGWPAGFAVPVTLVEPKNDTPYIYADVDRDGTFADGERFSFSPAQGQLHLSGELLLKLPLKNSLYKHYPVSVQHSKAESAARVPGADRNLLYTRRAEARGAVDIEGRKTLVQYDFDAMTEKIDPANGQVGMDTNGDGRIDSSFGTPSPESTNARKENVVFRVGNVYVSTKTVDTATGEIVFRTHPASDYQFIELRNGEELQDFSFTDFDGRSRKLSEFRGKYLLLDFWGTWCKPCVAEVPRLKEMYAKYQPRGFEILGIDNENAGDGVTAEDLKESLEKVKTFVAEKGITWTHATPESSKEIAEKRFRVSGYPTLVLLDPQGRIIALGLKSESLQEELEKVLPAL
jgi:thiol-disulfide isomerase/thioredoxin